MSCILCGKVATRVFGNETLCDYCTALKGEGCALCGAIILADTEDWKTPLCPRCYIALGEPEQEPPLLAQSARHARTMTRILAMTRETAKRRLN